MNTSKTISLNGQWHLCGRQECGAAVSATMEGTINCATTVPGNIEKALFDAGVIHDPYIHLNAMELRPYEFYEWLYTREFDC